MPKIYRDIKANVVFRFALSATLEMVASMHVITDPEHHTNCSDWDKKVKERLSADTLGKIKSFGKSYVNWSFVLDLVDYCTTESPVDDDFEQIMEQIRQMSDEEFAYIFLGETLLGDRDIAAKLLKAPEQFINIISKEVFLFIHKDNVFYFLKNVQKVKQEMLVIMEQYYDEYFRAYWETVRDLYRNKIAKEKEFYHASNPIDYILRQHQDLQYEKDQIVIKKQVDLRVETDKIEEVRMFFSMFTYPHLAANIYNNKVSIYKNLMMPMDFHRIDEIADAMKSFSDPNRLAIVVILSRQFATNKELAQMLDIAPSSVSQHLKILKDLDVVTYYKDKNNINYRINKEKEIDIIKKLSDFINLNLFL